MAKKKQRKKEVLGLVLAEVAKLREEVRALGKEMASVSEHVRKRAARSTTRSRPPAKPPAKKPAANESARKSAATPKRTVHVATPSGATTRSNA